MSPERRARAAAKGQRKKQDRRSSARHASRVASAQITLATLLGDSDDESESGYVRELDFPRDTASKFDIEELKLLNINYSGADSEDQAIPDFEGDRT